MCVCPNNDPPQPLTHETPPPPTHTKKACISSNTAIHHASTIFTGGDLEDRILSLAMSFSTANPELATPSSPVCPRCYFYGQPGTNKTLVARPPAMSAATACPTAMYISTAHPDQTRPSSPVHRRPPLQLRAPLLSHFLRPTWKQQHPRRPSARDVHRNRAPHHHVHIFGPFGTNNTLAARPPANRAPHCHVRLVVRILN